MSWSSSPLRGAATRPSGPCTAGRTRVIIAPTRGSNCSAMNAMSAPRWSSSPLRGAATRYRPGPGAGGQPVIIAPTRGSNIKGGGKTVLLNNASSSPLRGAATCSLLSPLYGREHVIIAPTRGSNRDSCTNPATSLTCHHRPYEGQQPRRTRPMPMSTTRSSSPLRGAATAVDGPAGDRGPPVIIAPTRGSNMIELVCQQAIADVIIAPTRGSNACASRLARCTARSSSPLRGAATPAASPACPTPGPVIIAPTRSSNLSGTPYTFNCPAGSSSPLRGAATRRPGSGRSRSARRSSSPLRGATSVIHAHLERRSSSAVGFRCVVG